MKPRRVVWDDYVESFHDHRPGITEEILVRCVDATGSTPYQWLIDGIDPAAMVLDVGCGSAPTRPLLGERWVGIDRSSSELWGASRQHRDGLVRGAATKLPIRAGTVDVVIFSMALMLIDPLAEALAEAHRVLALDGELRVLLPTNRPLTLPDRWAYARLSTVARSTPRFPPSPLRRTVDAFEVAAFEITSDDAQRFICPLDDDEGVRNFVESWYTPGQSLDRKARHSRMAMRHMPREVGVPLRRIIARRSVLITDD